MRSVSVSPCCLPHSRMLLLAGWLHRGYECKEPEPGKMTLAFRCVCACLCVRGDWGGGGGWGRGGCRCVDSCAACCCCYRCRHLEDAVEWACALQRELLGCAWPDGGERRRP